MLVLSHFLMQLLYDPGELLQGVEQIGDVEVEVHIYGFRVQGSRFKVQRFKGLILLMFTLCHPKITK